MLALHGAQAILGDLLGDWQDVLDGADAVVWAAGAGASGEFKAIDGDALVAAADVLAKRGPRRVIVVSSMGVDRPEQMPPFLAAVLRVKAVSDTHVQRSDLDWTIVRPGGLIDTPGTGKVQVSAQVPGGAIPRDDVAAVVLACLNEPRTIHQTFEIISGPNSIPDALGKL